MGRPSLYAPELGVQICEEVSGGSSLRSACAKCDVDESTARLWLKTHAEFSTQYARAREDRAHFWAEEFMDVADNGTNDWMEDNAGDDKGWKENGESLRRTQIRIDARKWMMARILPKQYGDKLLHGGDPDNPIEVAVKRVTVNV